MIIPPIQTIAVAGGIGLLVGFGGGWYVKSTFADAAAYKAQKAAQKIETELREGIAKRDGEISAQYAIADRMVKQLGTKVVTRETQRLIDSPALADCKLDPVSVRELNQAASMPANPGGSSVGLRLPGVRADNGNASRSSKRAESSGAIPAELPSASGSGEEPRSMLQTMKDMLK